MLKVEVDKSCKLRSEIDKLSLQIAQLESERDQLYLLLNKESESYSEILLSIEEERNRKIEEIRLDRQRENDQYQQEIDKLKIDIQQKQSGDIAPRSKFNKSLREK